ncbi:MAG: hypothetical protein ACKO3B_01765 [Bacteroidota bacterium]
MNNLIILMMLVLSVTGYSQKNVVPVSRSEVLGIPLPEGTKRDKRLLVVAAAAALAEDAGKPVNLHETATEVYMIPLTTGSNPIPALLRSVEDAGWKLNVMASKGYHYAIKNGRNLILFLEASRSVINLYVSECSLAAVQPAPAAAPAPEPTIVPSVGSPIVRTPGPPAPGSATVGNTLPVEYLGTWVKSGTMHYAGNWQVVKLGAGYITDQYDFNPDGTYRYLRKSVQFSDDKIVLVREVGTYEARGNQLTIRPSDSQTEIWTKLNNTDRFNSLKETLANERQVVTYNFTLYFFTGIQEWNLVLQAATPTFREGPFSNNTTYANAWYFKKAGPNSRPVVLPD